MIRRLAHADTGLVWTGLRSRRLPSDDLRVPRGNRLEQLKGLTPPR